MDPDSGCGAGPFSSLFESDANALDIIGWVVDTDNLPVTPDPCNLLLPPVHQVVDSMSPTLSWTPAINSARSHVVIARMLQGGEYQIVHRELDILVPTGSVTVPAGLLVGGTEYTWYVVSDNGTGVRHSEYRTFVTPGTACSADFDHDGVVNVADIFAFLSAWFAQGPGSDFNNDAAINVVDIFAFLSAWFAGCP